MGTGTRRWTEEITAIAGAMQALQRLRASRQVHGALARAAGVELSQQAIQVLLAVGEDQSVAQLAHAARMDVGAVSRQLRVLEAEGLVTRAANPDNGSVVLVIATPAGRALAERIVLLRDEHLGRAVAAWSSADRRQLAALLHRLVDDLQATPYRASDPRSTT